MLVPDLSYKTLEIQNGAMAMIAWHKRVYEDVSKAEQDQISTDLLKYCELDTLSMVKIWECLGNLY